MRKAGNRIRITCQLIDANTASQLRADRYDGELTEIFDLQDAVTEAVVAAIGRAVPPQAGCGTARSTTTSPSFSSATAVSRTPRSTAISSRSILAGSSRFSFGTCHATAAGLEISSSSQLP